MKVNLLILLLNSYCFCHAYSQVTWQWQSPKPTGNHLYDIAIVNDINIVAVGALGTVIRSADEGETWVLLEVDCDDDLNSVTFIDNLEGYAVGNKGTILKTSDGGISWVRNVYDTSVNFRDVFFIDNNVGWLVGQNGIVLKTLNSGENWLLQDIQNSVDLLSIFCINDSLCWVVGGTENESVEQGVVFKTLDGGNNWTIAMNSVNIFNEIFFINEDRGWIVGNDDVILKTDDSGRTWTSIPPSVTYRVDYKSIHFKDEKSGFVAGGAGIFSSLILQTDDGGETWGFTFAQGGSTSANAVKITSAGYGLSVGAGGGIYKKLVEESLWLSKHHTLIGAVHELQFANSDVGYIRSITGSVAKTFDGGNTWDLLRTPVNGLSTSMFVISEDTVWHIGDQQPMDNTLKPFLITKTIDGGMNWSTKLSTWDGINGGFFLDGETGWVIVNKTELHRTTNGGESWTSSNIIPQNSSGAQIYFVSKKKGWLIFFEDNQSTLLKTEDLGEKWVELQIEEEFDRNTRFFFINENEGWFIKGARSILHTIDGGLSWNTQLSNAPSFLRKLFFINENGWCVGGDGLILGTNNGGSRWVTLDRKTDQDLSAVFFINEQIGWIGGGKKLLKTANGHLTSVQSSPQKLEIPKAIELMQNYPNPFNPVTKIDYSLSSSQHISIKVYDILGKYVITLFDEIQSVGEYSALWNGRDHKGNKVASGVYIYQMKTENFTTSKKMVLLR